MSAPPPAPPTPDKEPTPQGDRCWCCKRPRGLRHQGPLAHGASLLPGLRVEPWASGPRSSLPKPAGAKHPCPQLDPSIPRAGGLPALGAQIARPLGSAPLSYSQAFAGRGPKGPGRRVAGSSARRQDGFAGRPAVPAVSPAVSWGLRRREAATLPCSVVWPPPAPSTVPTTGQPALLWGTSSLWCGAGPTYLRVRVPDGARTQ